MTKEIIKPKHKMGWIPDLPDHRDYAYNIIRKPVEEKIVKLPETVDLRNNCSKIEDQGSLGSCTANALVGNLEFLEIKDKIAKFEELSRLFVYYNERLIEHSINYDNGAMLRDGIKALSKWGDCSEIMWKYNISKFKTKPTSNCYTDASNHKITSYYRLNTTDEMRICLADKFPFVFGFSVYESFESDEVAKTGIVPMPSKNEQLLGGHAVCAVGYDDATQRFLIRNSWGVDWGISGYFYIPYKYLEDRNLSEDFWTIRKVGGM
jgi:C1A family cysteine protease